MSQSVAKQGGASANPYSHLLRTVEIHGKTYRYYDLASFGVKYDRLPYSIRVLLESCVRNCDNFQISENDVQNILDWETNQDGEPVEIAFKPARVILQLLALVDFAAMRDAVQRLGGHPDKINPVCPAELVVDHSVQVDFAKTPDALFKNEELEIERNKELFQFLKWAAQAFHNVLIIPPGSGIVHQVNVEHLARVVFSEDTLHPDSVVAADSHVTMVGGLGVLSWGCGGIECEAVMLGEAIGMLLPKVVGYRLVGELGQQVTTTDLVLTITEHLRSLGVIGKFVEFFGPGVTSLTAEDRCVVANMCPEYGATVAHFPVDEKALEYLALTNRSKEKIDIIETYLRATKQFRDYNDPSQDPVFSEVVELDLSTIVNSVSGPKRPEDRVPLTDMKRDFNNCLSNKVGFKGYGLAPRQLSASASFAHSGWSRTVRHGAVLLAALASSTNTSNPNGMLAAGLLAKKAVENGLHVASYIKTSITPGSKVVTAYLKESGLLAYLENLGFFVAGHGCATCVGNSGPLDKNITDAIEKNELVCVSVVSGCRNYEGRIHPTPRAAYLAAPPLVLAYALAGTVDIDFEVEPLGKRADGRPVFLRDVWPTRAEIREVQDEFVVQRLFKEVYENITAGSPSWRALAEPEGRLYKWDPNSTYIKKPPYFDNMTKEVPPLRDIENGRCLVYLGDSVSTDHIAPGGAIARDSPASRYLTTRGLSPLEFNSYMSRRSHHEVLARSCFANIRLDNRLAPAPGPHTTHQLSGDLMAIFDAAERYKRERVPLLVIAGKEYGSGSSRDGAAKAPYLVGIKAVIAESFERIHRSNLVGMGVMPLQFLPGDSAAGLALSGAERYTIRVPRDLTPGQKITVETDNGKSFQVIVRFDTEVDLAYFRHGGILNYMVRKTLKLCED